MVFDHGPPIKKAVILIADILLIPLLCLNKYMALDLYSGPLTRYFCGTWENIMARAFREQGRAYQLIHPSGEPPPEPIEPTVVENHIALWTNALSGSLGAHLSSPLSWQDDLSQPYDTDRPHWQGYCALLLTAAHADFPTLALPSITPERWDDHPTYVAAISKDAKSRFTQILLPELWLPSDFQFAFQAPGPASEEPIWIGAVATLLLQLNTLNDTVFHGSSEDLARWSFDGPPPDNNLLGCARFGFAIFHRMATFSRDHSLPLKLDY